MMKSMTAFGRAKGLSDGKDITAELKSVNNRYLDLTVKLPRAYSFLEERVKPYLMEKGISRGKLDVYIGIEQKESIGTTVTVDTALAEGYLNAYRTLCDTFGLRDDISVMSIARNSDIFKIEKPEEDAERDWDAVRPVLDEAVANFIAAREREGASIEADLLSKVKGIEETVEKIEKMSIDDISDYERRLTEKLRKALSDNNITVDESRILTECAIFADKVAIDEELVRLRTHFGAFREFTESREPVGRKLDFLMQEMNREINTIGSKCSNSSIAHLVVDVKTELEKIREQIQNIE